MRVSARPQSHRGCTSAGAWPVPCRGAEANLGWLAAKSVFHGVVDGEVDVDVFSLLWAAREDKDAASRAQA